MRECLVVNDGFQSGIEIISVTPPSLGCVCGQQTSGLEPMTFFSPYFLSPP